jgi:hypothetical protein
VDGDRDLHRNLLARENGDEAVDGDVGVGVDGGVGEGAGSETKALTAAQAQAMA